MSTVKDYTFYNLDRIEDDVTCETQRTIQNGRFSSLILSNYFNENPSDKSIKFATSQPAIVPNGVNGGSGVGGHNIEGENYLLLKTEQERALGRLNLLQRPYATVPYLGRGSCDPNVESQLRFGESVSDKKSVSTIMSQSFMGYTLHPPDEDMQEHVSDPRFTVEEAALEGWIRGGAATRDMAEDPYLRKR